MQAHHVPSAALADQNRAAPRLRSAPLAATPRSTAAHRLGQTMGEFELIERYFKRPVRRAALGVGDDCALLAPQPGMQLAVSSDMLVQGRHFLPTVAPEHLGWGAGW